MCSTGNENSSPPPNPAAIIPYSPQSNLKIILDPSTSSTTATTTAQVLPGNGGGGGGGNGSGGSGSVLLQPLDHYRLQLYNYAVQAERLRCQQFLPVAGSTQYPTLCPPYPAYPPRLALSMSLFHHRVFQPEEPKPQHSYIGLIAMAILSSPEHKLVLSDIYQYILDNYPYFRTRGPGWRNSIRHNLSLNDCFVKAGRSANGKGHYWAIHPANVEDFKKGDFRRRKAQRKVRKHMGLAVDDDGNDSSSPPPVALSPPPPGIWAPVFPTFQTNVVPRKRQFDVASLLAPDDDPEEEEEVDVVTSAVVEHKVPTAGLPPPSLWPYQPPAFPLGPTTPLAVDHSLVARYYEQARRLHLQKQQKDRLSTSEDAT
ncbi:forkhead domain 102C [Lycorma delicatula]|uniref:forkhead domain 102C n=1 Tax=Lycorma delicatula TaxID=130591 RepID=UPI003F50ED47